MRFVQRQLAVKALRVLDETIAECQRTQGPIRPNAGLRLALAYLANGIDRSAADSFWRSATQGKEGEVLAETFGRYQTLRCCAGVLARMNGFEPWL